MRERFIFFLPGITLLLVDGGDSYEVPILVFAHYDTTDIYAVVDQLHERAIFLTYINECTGANFRSQLIV